jgi:O-Antigen ligase
MPALRHWRAAPIACGGLKVSATLDTPGPGRPSLRTWLNRIPGAIAVIATGVMLGMQYVSPNKRVLSVLAGVVLFGMAWRIDMVSGIGILMLALPFPRGTTFGNTNLAFILFLLVIWLLRFSTGEGARPRRTPIDVALACLFTIYVISFYNVETTLFLTRALSNFELMIACMLMLYLIVSNVRTNRDLQRMHAFQAGSVLLVCLLAVYELNHPGQVFIRGWIDFHMTQGTEFNTQNVRVGSSFYDYELLSEYCAVNLLLCGFLLLRARTLLLRLAFAALTLLVLFVLFTTTTRGAIVALAVGAVYFPWLIRRRLNIVSFVLIVAGVVAGFFIMNFYVSHFTRSGNVLARFEETKFVGGLPDSRADAWPAAWKRMLEHPLIGHGPYYSSEHGLKKWTWPHCLYLYVGNNVGFLGLAIFLWFLWKLWRLTRPLSDDLRHADYATAFLIIARIQLLVFIVDQIKIEYLRNTVYQFQVWLMFAGLVSAYVISRRAQSATEAHLPLPRAA